MIRFIAGAAATAVLSLCAPIAFAQPAAAPGHRIAFGDLDMGSPEGAARFDRRLDRVARAACATGSRPAEAACLTAFRAEALDRLPQARRQDYAQARGATR